MIRQDYVFYNQDLKSKEDVLKYLSEHAKELGLVTDEQAILSDYHRREDEVSTGLTEGFAIPHARSENVLTPAVMIVTLKEPIEWESLDDKPIQYIISLLVPDDKESGLQVKLLSQVSRNLMKSAFRQSIYDSKNAEDLYLLFHTILKENEHE